MSFNYRIILYLGHLFEKDMYGYACLHIYADDSEIKDLDQMKLYVFTNEYAFMKMYIELSKNRSKNLANSVLLHIIRIIQQAKM